MNARQVIGDTDQPHTYTFIGDFACALAVIGEQSEAVGEMWHVPSAPTVTTRQFVRMIAQQAGTALTPQVTPSWITRGLGLVPQPGDMQPAGTASATHDVQHTSKAVATPRARPTFMLDCLARAGSRSSRRLRPRTGQRTENE